MVNQRRSRATLNALKKEKKTSASTRALSQQAKRVAKIRGAHARSMSAKKAAETRQSAG